ncbi:glutamate-gated chloride channel isoform X1 [Anopheles albimanus]|uniref:glutamate-gated chloride channel isoform X1 n=1 Tax=Anopheles albimanus TaxID=7167 RepID=UPI0016409DF1|nr:glutamate-gated chloride channel isoform X1 [Anopheles albimanus]XP_035779180.1 glutamate-gated chloride channel isoform X1 [Anopheles albimanus]XP_035779181.1 glutamate-gated chloride channel isoform X1 [Anopheles albimanus]
MAPGHVFWAIFYFACLCSASLANNAKVNFREKEKKILDQILGAGKYDARIRPSGINGTDDKATQVFVNMFLRSISKIDDYKMEYSVQLTFREQWLDERLKFDDIGGRLKYLTLTEANRVWMPDLFFSNEKEGHFHNIIMPNVYIRIFPYGSVLYSIRISLTLACPMNLKLYPLDRQVCSLRMASYGWTTADLVFLWKEGDPVQVVKNLHLPRFTLEKFLTDYCNSKTNTGKPQSGEAALVPMPTRFTNDRFSPASCCPQRPPATSGFLTGEYSCLKVDLLFKREFSYYLIQIYIPCCMLVIVSWVSFWLDQGAVPARVSLGVTTLLTMATQTSGINASLPPVSYTKAIDVWTGVCLTFVFGALLEFALVNYASRSADRAADMHRENMKKKRREMEQASLDAASDLLDTDSNATFAMKPLVRHPGDPMALEKLRQCEVHMQVPKRPNCCRSWLSKFPTRQCSRSKRIDVISRITFPLVFALFNLVYWSTYLFREEEED